MVSVFTWKLTDKMTNCSDTISKFKIKRLMLKRKIYSFQQWVPKILQEAFGISEKKRKKKR